ncbi:hypothetical protein BOTCAL_0259g00070 [Botryotinia calthae]|uniref:Uncharacterized protein n=1 Tax=Botryotinia calthae TaxID=38488 RepID=A0A4Y8CZ01_9HELO|nr:hypothetical protein BOTCAL_0259g00070 [Botryotinia calthae]
MFNKVKRTIHLLVIGDAGVGNSQMISSMTRNLSIFHLLEDNDSTSIRYPVIPEMGRPLELELLLQECSSEEELRKIMAKNIHFPRNIVLIFHCGSHTSFESCEVFYKIIQEDPAQYNFLWIANTDQSFGGTLGWKEKTTLLVNEAEPQFVLASLADPGPGLKSGITSWCLHILKSNQLATSTPDFDKPTLEVSTEVLSVPWMNGVLTTEHHTVSQPSHAGLTGAPESQFWIGGRNDTKSQKPPIVMNVIWRGNQSLYTMEGKEHTVKASIYRNIVQKSGYGKSNDEEAEIVAQSHGILNTLPWEKDRVEKSINEKDSNALRQKSISNEMSGWYTDDDEQEAGRAAIACWDTGVQWLRRLCFDCVGRR